MAFPKLFGSSKDKAKALKAPKPSKRKKVATLAPAPPAVPVPDMFHRALQSTGKNTLPRFAVSAADQPDRSDSDRFSAARLKLLGAFTPSQPVVDRRMFAGRLDLLTQAIRAIEFQRLHLVIYGERGIGKTSMLHMLANAAQAARYIVVYSSCGSASTFDELVRAVSAEMPLLFHTGIAPTSNASDAGTTFADLLPSGSILPRQFGDLCAKLTGTRVIIILDEFDRADSQDFRRDIAELIKTLSDRAVRVQLVIAGVAADLAELVQHIPSIRRNIIALRVPLMADDEVREIVTGGEEAGGVTFSAPARDLVVSVALGSPYVASLICHHAGLSALDHRRFDVQPADVQMAIEHSLAELRTRISNHTQATIDRLVEAGGKGLLGLIAKCALVHGGSFQLSDVDAIAETSAEATRCKSQISKLADERLLLGREDDGDRRFSFSEEGVASFLWFLSVREAVADEDAPARKSGVA